MQVIYAIETVSSYDEFDVTSIADMIETDKAIAAIAKISRTLVAIRVRRIADKWLGESFVNGRFVQVKGSFNSETEAKEAARKFCL